MITSFEERYAKLNTAQKEAVDTTEGPVLVVAGPGSGKTELLSLRVANILKQGFVGPQNILCLTFTENGALNMRARLRGLIGKDAYKVGIFTFHAFCNHVIGRYPEYFYNAASFVQASDLARATIFETLFKELPHRHPLASFHSEEGFVYQKDVENRITHIKRGGYIAQEFKELIEVLALEYAALNKIVEAWPEERMSIKKINQIETFIDAFKKTNTTTGVVLSVTLVQAIEKARTDGKTEAIAEWKKKYLSIGDSVKQLKDSYNLEKNRALADMYSRYTKKMHTQGLYDYDDMIIDTTHALKENSVLRNELEEQYQYILIDEFQDTNEAQMNLVRAITASTVHEDRPNVCVVGDDDQAIYKFQGAEVSHIISFRKNVYKDVKTIVLDKNYRSTESILHMARSVITQGVVRLENTYADITKKLASENKMLPKGNMSLVQYESDVEEYSAVAEHIKKAIVAGSKPKEIAVLARNHRELKAILPYLDQQDIPYEYIKKANVFEEVHIQQLISMCEYIASVLEYGHTKDYLVPIILSYPFWDIGRDSIFQIAADAKKENVSWMHSMKESADKNVKKAYTLLSRLAVEAHSTPLEHILEIFMAESGFKTYYFDENTLREKPSVYVYFLASLKTFFESLREYNAGEVIHVQDVAPLVEMHVAHAIPLTSESIFTKHENAVQLMTAHASKGLEFEHVYILSAHDALWTKAPRANKIVFPSPLTPILVPAGDSEDDFIRLLYVAITRAKHSLFISGHKDMVRYLDHEKIERVQNKNILVEIHEQAVSLVHTPYKENEWALMKRLVEHYTMPVTHLHNFLNVAKGGPLYFIEQNLLRFPQPMNPSGAYGSAIHGAIEEYIMYPRFHGGEKASIEHILGTFDTKLSKARLPQHEQVFMRNRGHGVLTKYIEHAGDSFLQNDTVEVDMRQEGVIIGEAHLTGKIDLLRIIENQYHVVDFKTGKAFEESDTRLNEHEKYKKHTYTQQMIYYKILLENSIHYKLPVASLALEFVEQNENGVYIVFGMGENKNGVERMKKLIDIVYKKIINLDFPDISKYEKNVQGVIAFEDDLLQGTI